MIYPRRPERRGYDTAQVCLNGHMVNAYAATQPQHSEKFCTRCGEPTVTSCTHCNSTIRGYYHSPGVYRLGPENPPSFCYECGKPYTWTERRLETARRLADECAELDSGEKDSFKETLNDLVKDTPETPLAAQRFRKLWAKIKGPTADSMKEVLVQVISETATKLIFSSGK